MPFTLGGREWAGLSRGGGVTQGVTYFRHPDICSQEQKEGIFAEYFTFKGGFIGKNLNQEAPVADRTAAISPHELKASALPAELLLLLFFLLCCG